MGGGEQRSKNLFRVIIVVALIGIAVVIVAAGRRTRTADRTRQVILSDGTKVELLGTSVGNATFTTETKWQGFAPDEQLVVTNLAVPSAGNFVSADQSADCAGVKISLLVLAGPGKFSISNKVTHTMSATPSYGRSTSSDGRNTIENWGNPDPFLLIETANTQDGDELEFHVHGENGKEIEMKPFGWEGQPGGRHTYNPSFTVPDGGKDAVSSNHRQPAAAV